MKQFELLGSNAQYIRYPLEHFFHVQKQLGVKFVDFVLQAPHIYIDSSRTLGADKVKWLMSKTKIKILAVTVCPYRYTICADKHSIQAEKSKAYFKQCILTAEALEANYICMTAEGGCFDKNKEKMLSYAVENLNELAVFAKMHHVTLLLGTAFGPDCPENAASPVLCSMEDVRYVMERVDVDMLKLYVDTEVISTVGETISDWLAEFGADIKLIRMTDGNYHGYRVWGDGCLPCSKYVGEIEKFSWDGIVSLQVPGEYYLENAEAADQKNRSYIKKVTGW